MQIEKIQPLFAQKGMVINYEKLSRKILYRNRCGQRHR